MAEIFIYYMYNLQLLGPQIRLRVGGIAYSTEMATTETLDFFDDEPNIFVEKDWIKAGKKIQPEFASCRTRSKLIII